MPVRAMWKGVIRFGAVSVPIKLYAAVQDRTIHFRLLHQADQAPVQQRMVHPRGGEPVPPEAIQRGYETDTGEIIVLSQQELQMAQQLVGMLEADFDPGQYRDEYRRRVYELMKAKGC